MRHTASHVLAQAVKKLRPEVKLAIGPAIDNGFYYDFDVDDALHSRISQGSGEGNELGSSRKTNGWSASSCPGRRRWN